MANDVRGEVGFSAGGKAYTIKFSTNAICSAEKELHKSVIALMAEIDWMLVRRGLLWATLKPFHPEVSIEDAGDIMDALGQPKTIEVLTQAFNAAFPPPGEGSGNARP